MHDLQVREEIHRSSFYGTIGQQEIGKDEQQMCVSPTERWQELYFHMNFLLSDKGNKTRRSTS
jgi:hypothetical protein